jgi:hypothetical protein
MMQVYLSAVTYIHVCVGVCVYLYMYSAVHV